MDDNMWEVINGCYQKGYLLGGTPPSASLDYVGTDVWDKEVK